MGGAPAPAPAKKEDGTLVETYEPHAAYDMKYLETIKPTHRPPVDLADRVGDPGLTQHQQDCC
jgi:hypothetical protein